MILIRIALLNLVILDAISQFIEILILINY